MSERSLAAVRNGNFAALLFINHWEYTRDASFAKTTTLPLLDGETSVPVRVMSDRRSLEVFVGWGRGVYSTTLLSQEAGLMACATGHDVGLSAAAWALASLN